MSRPLLPPKVKLFIGFIGESDELQLISEEKLIKKYGIIDFRTIKIPFTHTKYYKNIGSSLFKIFISFKILINREDIVKIKLYTNKLEDKFSGNKRRKINIDPGYLTLSNVYLASCKDYFHRIYIGKGVYLENEYRYVNKSYQPWDWTYPDYKNDEYLNFFYNIRHIYHNQLKKR